MGACLRMVDVKDEINRGCNVTKIGFQYRNDERC